MGILDKLLWRSFGVPSGILGRLGGKIMAGPRQRHVAAQIAEALAVGRGDRLLEIGFGPGVAVEHMYELIGGDGLIVGVDPSELMVETATARNAQAIADGAVRLLNGSVERIPYDDAFFDKAYAMNSFHLWPDPYAGLSEILRVLKPGGQLALSFFGPARNRVTSTSVRQRMAEAGFQGIEETIGTDSVLYVMGRKR